MAKTEFMLIGSRSLVHTVSDSNLNIMIENRPIKQVKECKTLRVIVDQHLSWKSNTESICKKITSAISVIRKLKEFVDRDTLVSIFNAIVQPYFTYCCEVWDIFVAKRIREDIYADDLVSGAQDDDEAVLFYTKARTLMTPGGFNLRSGHRTTLLSRRSQRKKTS
ncbi:Hypothetical predicted protein [Paramuricea clavata]|uniref:Uncharacterized protein n=1 Tax=Paramuricea clavata TaxID=317549 RepID=A0A6S7HKB8_PARCT|nr:Hypothetical predicted protein [Paramuricea clavata]